MTRAAGAQPVALGAAAVPGAGREAQHFGVRTDHFQRPDHDVHQHRDRLDVALHRTRAIDQEAHQAIGCRQVLLPPKQAPLGRRTDQLRQPAPVDVPLLLAETPAVALRPRQDCAQHSRQPGDIDALLADAPIEQGAVIVEQGLAHQISREQLAVVARGENAVALLGLGKGLALAAVRRGHAIALALVEVEQQCEALLHWV